MDTGQRKSERVSGDSGPQGEARGQHDDLVASGELGGDVELWLNELRHRPEGGHGAADGMEQPWIGDEFPVLRGGAEREELEPGMLDELLDILVRSDCHTVEG
jgi:hypothetical protein